MVVFIIYTSEAPTYSNHFPNMAIAILHAPYPLQSPSHRPMCTKKSETYTNTRNTNNATDSTYLSTTAATKIAPQRCATKNTNINTIAKLDAPMDNTSTIPALSLDDAEMTTETIDVPTPKETETSRTFGDAVIRTNDTIESCAIISEVNSSLPSNDTCTNGIASSIPATLKETCEHTSTSSCTVNGTEQAHSIDQATTVNPAITELCHASTSATQMATIFASSAIVPYVASDSTATNTQSATKSNVNIPHKGLINLGNTCYLNSALQMLMSIDDFVTEIIELYQQDSNNLADAVADADAVMQSSSEHLQTMQTKEGEEQKVKTINAKYPLRDALAQFFLSTRQMASNDNGQNHNFSAVDPTQLKKVIDEKTSLFAGFWQQDSHEFLSTLLDLLHVEIVEGEDVQSANGNNEETSSETEVVDNSKMLDGNDVEEDDFIVIEKEGTLETPDIDLAETKEGKISNKKARVGSITQASSYSELNLEGIGSLLHGEKERMHVDKKDYLKGQWLHLETESSGLQCKLIGGRIAVIAPEPKVQVIENSHISEPSNNINNNVLDANETSSNDEPESVCAKPLWTDNVVDNFFTMAVRTHLTCDSCKYTRSHEEVFRHLSIEVRSASEKDVVESCHKRSIQEGLRKFFQEEKRELSCEKCFFESATQASEVTKLPKSLIVHLKRFIVDISADYTSISYRKNRAAIEFGDRLSLQESDQDGILGEVLANDVKIPRKRMRSLTSTDSDDGTMSCSDDEFEAMSIASEQSYIDVSQKNHHYKIRSVVNHIGQSAQCGHYTADAHKIYSNDAETHEAGYVRKWTRFNDSFVSQIDESVSMGRTSQETAYMIMYELEG